MLESYSRPEIPTEIRERYETELSKQYRWVDALTESSKQESDLDHVAGLFDLANEVKNSYPTLGQTMNWRDIEDMIYVHDAGEIISGDYVISKEFQEVPKDAHKRRERLGFHWMVRKHVKDPDLRRTAAAIYERYVNYKPDDKESQFVHLLDKIQAIRFGLRYVFDDRHLNRDLILQHAGFSITLLNEYAIPLLNSLSGDMRMEVSTLVQIEIGKFRHAGYPELADEARVRFFKQLREDVR